MKKLLIGLSLALLGACSSPFPEAVPLANAEATAKAILTNWGFPQINPPRIWGVRSNCVHIFPNGQTAHGFINEQTNSCVGGFALEDGSVIYILIHPWYGYSSALPHELVHTLYGDGLHLRPDLWEAKGGADSLEAKGKAFLAAHPELNEVFLDNVQMVQSEQHISEVPPTGCHRN